MYIHSSHTNTFTLLFLVPLPVPHSPFCCLAYSFSVTFNLFSLLFCEQSLIIEFMCAFGTVFFSNTSSCIWYNIPVWPVEHSTKEIMQQKWFFSIHESSVNQFCVRFPPNRENICCAQLAVFQRTVIHTSISTVHRFVHWKLWRRHSLI